MKVARVELAAEFAPFAGMARARTALPRSMIRSRKGHLADDPPQSGSWFEPLEPSLSPEV